MEWLTYNRECGFNIVNAEGEQEAEKGECIVLDKVEEVDSKIIKRIRELLEDLNDFRNEKIEKLVEDVFENEYDSKEFIRSCVYEHYEKELLED